MKQSILLIPLLILCCAAFFAQGETITLDPTVKYQTMTGWVASSYALQYNQTTGSPSYNVPNPNFDVYRDVIASKLVNGSGVNRVRVGMRCGVEYTEDVWAESLAGQIPAVSTFPYPVNDNSDPNVRNDAGFQWSELDGKIDSVVVPLKKFVESNKEHLMVDLNYVCMKPNQTIHMIPAEYAELVLATYQHMQTKYGFVPDVWSTILEPDNGTSWGNGAKEGAVLKAAGDLLRANGFTPNFAVANTECMSNAPTDFDNAIATSGALAYIGELGYHRYCGVSAASLSAIAARVKTYNIKSTMSEWWSSSNNYKVLYDDLVNGLVSGWEWNTAPQYYTISFNPSFPQNPSVAADPVDRMKLIRQYFLFVRYGAQRIGAISSSGAIFPVAFINPPGPTISGGQWTVVAYTTGGTPFTINGLPAGTYGIKYALAGGAYDQNLTDQTITDGQSLTTAIPGEGVITIYGKQNLATVVTVTAPVSGANLSGTAVALSAVPSGGAVFAGVQFKLDGTDLGAETTGSPYSITWDTTNTANGSHVLTAVVRDTAGNQTASQPVTVTVNNAPPYIPYSVSQLGGGAWNLSNSGSLRVEYARVQPDNGALPPNGMAIIGFNTGGVLVSEAGVPAAAPVGSGRIYAETSGFIRTGIALANPSGRDTVVSFYFTDVNGLTINSGSFTLAANHQTAAFLDQQPFNGPAAIQGTFTFSASPSAVSAVALRGFTNERSEFLLTTLPVSAPVQGSVGQVLIFPHFVSGGGWNTEPVLINPTDSTLSGSVQFFAQDSPTGTTSPVNIQVGNVTGSTFPYVIPPRGQFHVTAAMVAGATKVGWVQITPDSNTTTPAGIALLTYVNSQGITASETGILATPAGSAFRTYVEILPASGQTGSVRSGIALCNPSNTAVTVQFDLRNLDGSSTGLSTTAINLPPNGQIARFIDEFLPQTPAPFRGMLRLTSTSPIFTAALRGRNNERGDFLMSTTAPSNEATVTAGAETDFAQVVSGGGYSTQIVLFSGANGSSGTGTISFVFPDGTTPLNQNRQPLP